MSHQIRTLQRARAARRDTWTGIDSGWTTWNRGRRCRVAPPTWIA